MSQKKPYDTTVARIAGNILSGAMGVETLEVAGANATEDSLAAHEMWLVRGAVRYARAIVTETKRTEALAGKGPEDE
jgi:hypothetical protein